MIQCSQTVAAFQPSRAVAKTAENAKGVCLRLLYHVARRSVPQRYDTMFSNGGGFSADTGDRKDRRKRQGRLFEVIIPQMPFSVNKEALCVRTVPTDFAHAHFSSTLGSSKIASSFSMNGTTSPMSSARWSKAIVIGITFPAQTVSFFPTTALL